MTKREGAMRLAARLCLVCTLAACGGGGSGKPTADAGSGARDAGHAPAHDDEDGGTAAAPDAATVLDAGPSRVCSTDGFCWELPSPQGETLRAAWAAAPDDVWAVGDGGVLLHYDGTGFRAEHPGTDQDLLAVHGSGPDDVWAVGNGGDVLHYDGKSWSVQDLGDLIDASGGSMTGVLHGVFAAAPDAVWAVGHSGVSAVVIHYDGKQWTNQSLGLQTDQVLNAVWGLSAERVWAVGDGGVILSFDGTAWSADRSPTGRALLSLHALAEHDVWAVGQAGTAVHWDGTAWKMANKGLAGTDILHSVRVDIAAPAPTDAGTPMTMPMPADAGMDAGLPPAPEGPWRVWAFGEGGKVFRYNGELWAELPSGSPLSLYGAARVAQGELIAVGELGQITRFSGDARQSMSQGSRHNHLALWGDGTTLWAVGDEIARRDAQGWSVLPRPTDRSLYGVWGDASGLWAVGTAGTVVRYENGAFNTLDVAAAGDTWLRGVWGAGHSVWIVGHGGLAMVNAAGGFIAVSTTVHSNLLDVWGSADDRFWAVGEGGTVLRWDGSAWAKVPTGPMGGVVQNLRAVWGSGDDDVWVVGTESTILHWDGKRFEDQSRGASYSLDDVWGRSPDEVYAVGSGGVALRYDGSGWNELATGTQSSLESVFGDDAGRVFAAGTDGALLVLDPQ